MQAADVAIFVPIAVAITGLLLGLGTYFAFRRRNQTTEMEMDAPKEDRNQTNGKELEDPKIDIAKSFNEGLIGPLQP